MQAGYYVFTRGLSTVARDRAKAKVRVKIGQAPHEGLWGSARGIQSYAPEDWEDMASAAFGIEWSDVSRDVVVGAVLHGATEIVFVEAHKLLILLWQRQHMMRQMMGCITKGITKLNKPASFSCRIFSYASFVCATAAVTASLTILDTSALE